MAGASRRKRHPADVDGRFDVGVGVKWKGGIRVGLQLNQKPRRRQLLEREAPAILN